jgi:hypothetical protein
LLPVVMGVLLIGAAACDEGSSGGDGGAGAATGAGAETATSTGPGPGPGPSSSNAGGSSGGAVVIDDMEDQNGSITPNAGMIGAWYTYNDETATGTQTPTVGDPFMMAPVPSAHGSSAYAANTKGSGFTTWGAGFGFDLNNDGVAKKAYNAAAYTGITFWALAGAGSATSVRVNIGDSQTTPEAGACGTKCSDDFGQQITLTNSWQQFTIPFNGVTTVNWSMQNLTAIKKDALYYIHFQTAQNQAFDIWIDDIAFTQ